MYKKGLNLFIIVCLAMVAIPVSTVHAETQATFYVSPSGSDSNPGTFAQPFATLGKARDEVRAINSDMTGDIYVYLRGGTYTLSDTFELDSSDSGTNGYNIIYKNYADEKPIISGGASITGWSLHDSAKTIYKATVPTSFETRQLYVNGVRAVRAKGGQDEVDFASWTKLSSNGYTSGGYSSNANTVYVTVDLNSSQTVGSVELFPIRAGGVGGGSAGFPVDFTIQVSTDGVNFSAVKTVTNQANPNGVSQKYNFTPTSARYIKINATKLGSPLSYDPTTYLLMLQEINIYASGNLALGKSVTSNSSEEVPPSLGAANLTDGTNYYYSSYSNSSENTTSHVTVDLGSSQTVGRVKLFAREYFTMDGDSPDFPVDFTIQLSTDGTNFNTVKTVTGQKNPHTIPQDYTFTPASARYIKINATKLGIPANEDGGLQSYRLQFSEMEVYASANLALNKTAVSNDSVEAGPFGISKITDGYTGLYSVGYTSGDSSMASWHNISNMEVHLQYLGWQHYICGIESISGTKVTIKPYSFINIDWYPNETSTIKWIENAYELLNSPGEWYLDQTGVIDGTGIPKIYYKPRYGENMQTAEFIAPKVETLVKGTGSLDSPVHNIHFVGLSFQHSTWLEPSNEFGYNDKQGGFRGVGLNTSSQYWKKAASALSFYAAKSLNFERNVFTHIGGAALNIQYGGQDNQIVGNRFEDISGNGIYLGDARDHHPSDTRAIIKDNTIKNNFFTRVGQQYYDSVPIWVGYTENTLIEHNEIYSVSYTGINVGWGWGEFDVGGPAGYTVPTVAKDNKVQYNLVKYAAQKMYDGASLYMLGFQPGSTATYNYFDHVGNDRVDGAPIGLIYPDSASSFWDIQHNVVSNGYYWLLIPGDSGTKEITARNNYSSTSNMLTGGSNHTINSNTTVTDGNWPTPAQTIMANAGIENTYTDIKVSSNDNLALYQVATTNSSEELTSPTHMSYLSITQLTDGNRTNFYTSMPFGSANNTVNTVIDLGENKTVGSVKLFPRLPAVEGGDSLGFPVNFTIQVSTDGTNYSTVRTITGQANPKGLGQEYAFAPATARYVKVNATQLGNETISTYRLQFAEIEVYSKSNLAWGKPVTATNSSEFGAWGADRLNDGNTSYVYGSAGFSSFSYTSPNNTVYVQVDLGSTQSISEVKLYPRSFAGVSVDGDSPCFPVDFTIQVSTDGVNFTTVKTVTNQPNPNGNAEAYSFAATNARYVKLNATKLGKPVSSDPTYYFLQLSEMEVFP